MKKWTLFIAGLLLLSTTVSSFATPQPPQLCFSATGLDLSIDWNIVNNATGYTLYYAPFPYTGEESIDSFDMGGETEFHIRLWEGAAYYIAVTSHNLFGESDYSNIEQFKVFLNSTSSSVIPCDFYDSECTPNSSVELCGDGIDNDCNGYTDSEEFFICSSHTDIPPTNGNPDDNTDVDGDGYSEEQGDCNDTRDNIYPEAYEVCQNGIDEDCNGLDDSCPSSSILIMIDKKFNDNAAQRVARLSTDIESDLSVATTIVQIAEEVTTPQDIREIIINAYETQGLKGVIFIGDIPFAYTESEYCTRCIDITYYEDLDEEVWEDPDGNGVFNVFVNENGDLDQYLHYLGDYKWRNITWTGIHNSEIWSGYLIPPKSIPLQSRIQLLKNYLDNNHNYRIGGKTYAKGMVYLDSVSHNEIESDPEYDFNTIYDHALTKYETSWLWDFDSSSLEFIWDENIHDQMNSWLNTVSNSPHEFGFISVHGSQTAQWFGGEHWLTFNDYIEKPPNTFLLEIASCNNGDLQSPDNLASWMLFSGETLAITANMRPTFYAGGHEMDPKLRLLSLGTTVGEATRIVNVSSGVNVVFGDPSLRLRGFNEKGTLSVRSAVAPTERINSFGDDGGNFTLKNISDDQIAIYYRGKTITSVDNKILTTPENVFQVYFWLPDEFNVFNKKRQLDPGEEMKIDVSFRYNGPFDPVGRALPGTYRSKLLVYTDSSNQPYFTIDLQKTLTE